MLYGRRAALCAALAAGLSLAATPSLARDDINQAASKAYARAYADISADNCEGALKQLSPVIARKDFAALAEPARLHLLMASVSCELQTRQLDATLAHVTTVTTLSDAPTQAWTLRLALELEEDKLTEAVTTLEAIQQRKPEAFGEIEADWIFILNRQLRKAEDNPLRHRLYAVVTSEEFQPSKGNLNYDGMRLAYARMRVQSGEKDAAETLVATLTHGYVLQEASLDIALKGYLPAHFSLRAAYERQISILQQKSRERPDLLEFPVEIARAYRILGQSETALAVLEAARPYGILSKQFSDRDAELNWWWDELARNHARAGRYAEAVSAFQSAIESGESSSPNVSQTINLAYLHTQYGHPEAALATLTSLEQRSRTGASPYGLMEFHLARGCAAQSLGKTEMAQADLAFIEEHAGDHPEAATDLHICMGDMDGAAASMVERLGNPETRINALRQLSTYAPAPAEVPPSPFAAGLAALRERPDVQAGISRTGGIRDFDVAAPEL